MQSILVDRVSAPLPVRSQVTLPGQAEVWGLGWHLLHGQAGELARDCADHAGRCNRPVNRVRKLSRKTYSARNLLDINRETVGE